MTTSQAFEAVEQEALNMGLIDSEGEPVPAACVLQKCSQEYPTEWAELWNEFEADVISPDQYAERGKALVKRTAISKFLAAVEKTLGTPVKQAPKQEAFAL